MCFITIELRRSYAVTAIELWPVIAKNCDAVTHNYEKKTVVMRSYDKKIVTMRKYVTVFHNYRFQLKCKYSATVSYILCHWLLLMKNHRRKIANQNDFACSSIFIKYSNAYTSYKKSLTIPFAKSSHILRFRKIFFAK